jgi:hypothetical protein
MPHQIRKHLSLGLFARSKFEDGEQTEMVKETTNHKKTWVYHYKFYREKEEKELEVHIRLLSRVYKQRRATPRAYGRKFNYGNQCA